MAQCIKTGENLPERNARLCGFECRNKDRFLCENYSHVFVDGVNCRLLRKPVDVAAILGVKK